MRDESASIVVISGTNCDRNDICKFPYEGPDLAGLFHSGFGSEHVEQIIGNTDEVKVWSLFDQPPE